MSIELDDTDKKILRDCPIRIVKQKNSSLTKGELARMKRIKRLWSGGLVGGAVSDDGLWLTITIRDPGRLAIGRPAIETPVAEVSADA